MPETMISIERPHLGIVEGLAALARCAGRTLLLIARERLHEPSDHIGGRPTGADGPTPTLYPATTRDPTPHPPATPAGGFPPPRGRGAPPPALFPLRGGRETNPVCGV